MRYGPVGLFLRGDAPQVRDKPASWHEVVTRIGSDLGVRIDCGPDGGLASIRKCRCGA